MLNHATVERVIRRFATADSDRELLRRFTAESDQAAFTALVERHTGLVLGVCRRALAHPQDAEDACQATFLILARKAKSQRWQPSVASWLYSTARRVARNARVAAQRRARREGRAAVPELQQDVDRISGRELLAILDEELDKLPPRYREALVLCYLEGLTRDEAAARLGVPAATLKSRLERGRKKLCHALTARGCALGVGLLATAMTATAEASSPRLIDAILATVAGRPPAAVAALAKGAAVSGVTFHTLALAAALVIGAAALAVGFGRDKPVAAQPPANAAPAKDAKPNVDAVSVAGRVVGPDGKPVAGAKLFTEKLLKSEPQALADIGLDSVGQSAADGTFRVSLKPQSAFPRRYLGAYAPGYAVDWVEWTEVKATDDVTLRLVKEQPITGRVITTEGKPIAGVSVSVTAIAVAKDDNLDDYLAGVTKNWQDGVRATGKMFALPLDPYIGTVKTDKDGKFTLAGVAPDRIAHVAVSGRGLANATGQVITRPGFNPKPYNEGIRDERPLAIRSRRQAPIFYGPEMTVVAEPGVSITGVVKDAESGKALAGCRVATYFGFGEGASVTTDATGAYTLAGIPKEKTGYSVSASFAKGTSTYLLRRKQAADAEGFDPIRLDIELIKGAVVTGRITDKRTGKAVVAGVRFAPLADNKFFASKPGFDNYLRDRMMQQTDADGRFRLVTIPGRALVMAQIPGNVMFGGQPLSPYRRAVPDEADRPFFKYDQGDDTWTIATAGGTEMLATENVVKVIDIKPDGETNVELLADPGVSGKIAVQDADGQPLAGAWVAGLTEHWPITYKLPEATATVYALTPGKPRTLYVYHAGKKLGGSVTIRGDETEPVVAKLALGRVTGRLLDADGNALGGVDVSVGPASEVGRELYRFARPAAKPVRTDKEGRFTLTDVMPGMPFYLDARREKESFGGKPKIGQRTLKPGETLDVGDRKMELLR